MNLQPIGDYIIVRDVTAHAEMKTKSGIILQSANSKQKAYFGVQGTVVGVSEQCKEQWKKQIRIGDRVWFNKYETVPFDFDGVSYEAIHDHWVFGKG